MIIDTHCHLTFPQLAEQVDQVIDAARSAGVDRMVTVGVTPEDALRAAALVDQHEDIFFTVGIHPHYIEEHAVAMLTSVESLVPHPKCVAFGEMGVDYHYDKPAPSLQHEAFESQLDWVKQQGASKPIIIHCRKAVDDTLAILRRSQIAGERFVFHCCTEPPEEVKKILDFGAMISFTGIVTYKNAPEVRASALLVPDDRIMVETDAPYLSPEPHRKTRPNQPAFVTATVDFLADLRSTSVEQFAEKTTKNAERFFSLPLR